jgi:xanthosine phosphorylase
MTPEEHKNNVEQSRGILLKALGARKPKIAIILGSGLGGLADKIENPVRVAYADLPGFPTLTVAGHEGVVVAGTLGGAEVIALKGRKHFYETDDAYPLKTMIRTMKMVGAEVLFVSNAAGSLNKNIGVGEIMLISDHINQMGTSVLAGLNDDNFGPRFVPLTQAWDNDLRDTMKRVAAAENITLHEGVYIAVRGPTFETPAEIRMFANMGGDAIGMSSVPDCIIANHCGLRVVGASCITNMGAGLSDEKLSHAHTLENAAKVAGSFERLVTAAVRRLVP